MNLAAPLCSLTSSRRVRHLRQLQHSFSALCTSVALTLPKSAQNARCAAVLPRDADLAQQLADAPRLGAGPATRRSLVSWAMARCDADAGLSLRAGVNLFLPRGNWLPTVLDLPILRSA
jgi:hypothetical protein